MEPKYEKVKWPHRKKGKTEKKARKGSMLANIIGGVAKIPAPRIPGALSSNLGQPKVW